MEKLRSIGNCKDCGEPLFDIPESAPLGELPDPAEAFNWYGCARCAEKICESCNDLLNGYCIECMEMLREEELEESALI